MLCRTTRIVTPIARVYFVFFKLFMPAIVVLGALTHPDAICAPAAGTASPLKRAAESCTAGSRCGGQGQAWAKVAWVEQEEMTPNHRQNSDHAPAKPPRAWKDFKFTFARWLRFLALGSFRGLCTEGAGWLWVFGGLLSQHAELSELLVLSSHENWWGQQCSSPLSVSSASTIWFPWNPS